MTKKTHKLLLPAGLVLAIALITFAAAYLYLDLRERTNRAFNNLAQLTGKVKKFEAELSNKDRQIEEIVSFLPAIPFQLQQKVEYYELNKQVFELKKFRTHLLLSSKGDRSLGSSYLAYAEDALLIVGASGIFSYVRIDSLNDTTFNAEIISSNIKDIVRYPQFYSSRPEVEDGVVGRVGIKDVFIHNNQIFISYSNQAKEDCYNTAILVAEFNRKHLAFERFFTPDHCVDEENDYGYFEAHQSGGRMYQYKGDKILFTTGEWRYRPLAQDNSKLFGKILTIDLKTRQPQIVSTGHRNPQGLFYDAENDLIVSTEHGARGGDEVNININPDDGIKNYGWPIASYSTHYGYLNDDRAAKAYQQAPLYKSHSEHGFEEPIKYFSPSIGISQTIKLEEKFIGVDGYQILVSSLGNDLKEGDKSLHHIILGDDYQVIEHSVLPLDERIRDLIYVEEVNKVILFLETTASIGVLSPISTKN